MSVNPVTNSRLAATLLALGALLAGFIVFGCASSRTDHLTLAAPRAVSTAFDVHNPFGSVEMKVDPKAERVTVTATYESDTGGLFSGKKGADALDNVLVFAETQSNEAGRTVTTIAAQRIEEGDTAVRLMIVTPRCEGVRVRAAGEVVLSGVRGGIEVENEHGAIDVRTDRPVRDPVALVAQDGNVYLTAPLFSQGRVDVQAPKGEARLYSQQTHVRNVVASEHRYQGQLASGENSILLRSERGNASLILHRDPMGQVRTIR